jgi:tetratricopeptide (TPR) repeat protein|tara:strand:- start:474 stop:1067 length:594 start_codon:yes stop_codon:yes gene_type:complete
MAVKIRRKTFRQKIKEPDEFISFAERALKYSKENSRNIFIISTLTVLIIASIGFFINWYTTQRTDFFSKTYKELMLANNNFDDNQYDEASEIYSEITKDHEQSSLFNEIAMVGTGYSLMEKKEYDKSIKIFEDLVGRVDFKYPKEELYKNLALLYEKTGKDEKAIGIYQKLVELYPQSNYIPLYMNKLAKSAKFQHP